MSFTKDLENFARNRKKSINKVFRAACLQMSNAIILRTPIDLGRARGNWQGSIGQPKTSEIDRNGEGPAMAAAAATIGRLKTGETFYLSNNLPYIKKLESGIGSRQAPQGMVAVTVAGFQQAVETAARREK